MIFAQLNWTFLFYSKVQSGFIWPFVDMIFHIMWVISIMPNLKCSFEYEIILCLCAITITVLSFQEYDTIQMEFKHEFSLKYTLFQEMLYTRCLPRTDSLHLQDSILLSCSLIICFFKEARIWIFHHIFDTSFFLRLNLFTLLTDYILLKNIFLTTKLQRIPHAQHNNIVQLDPL